jgi:gas vesicle protein
VVESDRSNFHEANGTEYAIATLTTFAANVRVAGEVLNQSLIPRAHKGDIIMRWTIGSLLIALAAVVGCQKSVETQQKELRETQRDAAENIREKQQDVIDAKRDANKDVVEERRELNDAIREGQKDVNDAARDVEDAKRREALKDPNVVPPVDPVPPTTVPPTTVP